MATHSSFFVSLSDVNLDRFTARPFADLDRDPDWRAEANYLDRVRDLLDKIPPVERDIVELYYFQHKKQDVIARMLGLSQQAVSYRLQSAYRRLTFLLEQPAVQPERMAADLRRLIANPFTVRVMVDFSRTSSQTATARHLKVPQQRVCWHLNAGLRALRAAAAGTSLDAVFYLRYFEALRQHRNILREVQVSRPRGQHGRSARRYARFARGPAGAYQFSSPVPEAAERAY